MRYFSGSAADLGHVTALPYGTFAELVQHLSEPIALPYTLAQLLALPPKEQQRAKRVEYITPAAFNNPASPRTTDQAKTCNLIALDIDDAAEAQRILKLDLADVLGELGFVAWRTARSTPEAPRLRVLVSAEAIPVSSYRAAVRTIASLLGLAEPTTESMVAVQPMFVPTVFTDSTEGPIFAQNSEGDAFTISDSTSEDHSEQVDYPNAPPSDSDGVKDITHLRAPLDDVTPEDAAGALTHLDPDCAMGQWIEVGAALKHQFNEAGFALWDAWSAKGKKYDADEMAGRWRSLKANPADRAPVTLRSVFRLAKARGWVNASLSQRAHQATMEWLRSESRSGEELLDQGCQRIAQVAASVGTLERKTLVITLRDRLEKLKLPLAIADIRRKVRELEVESSKASGIPPWAKGVCFVTSAGLFYRPSTDRRFTPEVLDLMYSTPQVSDDKPMRPRDYLMQIVGVNQVENLRYEPKHGAKRFFTEEDKPFVNTYRPSGLIPNADTANEAGDLFQAHIAHLVREPEYQRLLIDFLAFHVQRPGEKVRWATVLQGTQGCGKSFIGAAMAALLGRRNVRKLTASDVMEGNHNGWAYGQQLIVLEEVRIAGANRYAVMDKLKPCISDDEISVRRLYEAHQTVPNVCNYLMFTNHHDSLAVHDDDRRYFVLASPLQQPEQVAALGGAAYFDQLFGLLRDNPGGLLFWMQSWSIGKEFKPNGRAPVTPYLRELADAAASPLSSAVQQTIEDEPHPLVRRDLLSMGCLRHSMTSENLRDFSDQALAGVLRELGWVKVGRHMVEGQRHALWSKGPIGNAVQRAVERAEFL